MSDPKKVEKAIKWLRDQQESLKALRNASTRDPQFKEWRQATLTYVQRIWPGDAKRSGRFRRVPFSPPSSRADRTELRLAYERGISEAMKLLDLFIEELEQDGISENGGTGGPPSLSSMNEPEHDFPRIELPGDADAGAEDESDASSRDRRKGRRNGRKKGGARKRLKEMLGFSDEEGTADVESETPRPLEEPVEEVMAIEPEEELELEEAESSSVVEAEPEAAEPVEPVAVEADEPDDEVDLEAAEPESRPSNDEQADEREDFGDFLNASPIFQAATRARRPAPPAKAAAGREKTAGEAAEKAPGEPAEQAADVPAPVLQTAGALAVAAMAADLARFDVPEDDREDVRAALLELADRIEAGDLSWSGLRSAIDCAMEHPAVARRILPLLIPYLDRAA